MLYKKTFINVSLTIYHSQGVKLQNQSIIHVFYNDIVSTRYRTDMYQNWMSVLAMFGGLTGLFLGFSLVTGYEIGTYPFGKYSFCLFINQNNSLF